MTFSSSSHCRLIFPTVIAGDMMVQADSLLRALQGALKMERKFRLERSHAAFGGFYMGLSGPQKLYLMHLS